MAQCQDVMVSSAPEGKDSITAEDLIEPLELQFREFENRVKLQMYFGIQPTLFIDLFLHP